MYKHMYMYVAILKHFFCFRRHFLFKVICLRIYNHMYMYVAVQTN